MATANQGKTQKYALCNKCNDQKWPVIVVDEGKRKMGYKCECGYFDSQNRLFNKNV